MKEVVSVIIPVYNAEKFLKECLDSIIGQTYEALQIILIDDGSSDESGMICDEYAKSDSRILVIHKKNGGVSAARNLGIELAEGKWITFIDADDWVELDLLNRCLELKEDNDIIFYGVEEKGRSFETKNKGIIDERDNRLNEEEFQNLMVTALDPYASFKDKYKYINSQGPYGKIIKTELIKKHDIKFDPNLALGEDILFNLNLFSNAKKGLIVYSKMYYYRVNQESVLHKYNPQIFESLMKAFVVINKYIQKGGKEELKKAFKVFVVRKFMYCIRLNYCNVESNYKYKSRKKMFLTDISVDIVKKSFMDISLKSLKNRPAELVAAFFIRNRCFLIIDILNKLLVLKEKSKK